MQQKIVTLDGWDTYRLAEGGTGVDTLWATASVISVIRAKKKIDTARGFPALVGHFSTPEHPALREFLREARQRFGDEVKVVVRGGAPLLMDSDPAAAKRELTAIAEAERARFIKALLGHRHEEGQLDIVWAKANEATKIVYRARSGVARVFTRTIDQSDIDVERLPDVF